MGSASCREMRQVIKRLVVARLSGNDARIRAVEMYLDGKSPREIARELGVPLGLIKNSVTYVKRDSVFRKALTKVMELPRGLPNCPLCNAFFTWSPKALATHLGMKHGEEIEEIVDRILREVCNHG